MKSSSHNDSPNLNHGSGNIKQYEKELSNLENQNFNLKLQLYHSNMSNQKSYSSSLNQDAKMGSNQYQTEINDSNMKFPHQSESDYIPQIHQNTLSNNTSNSILHDKYDYSVLAHTPVSTTGNQYISSSSYPYSTELQTNNKLVPTSSSSFTINNTSASNRNTPSNATISFNTTTNSTARYSPPFANTNTNTNTTTPSVHKSFPASSSLVSPTSALRSNPTLSSNHNNLTPSVAVTLTTADIIKHKDMEIMQSLQDQLNDIHQKYKQSQNVVEYCMQQINTFKTDIHNYKTQVTEKDEKIKQLTELNQQLAYELDSYKTVNRNHNATYQELLQQKTNLETSLVHLHSKQESYGQESTRLQTQYNDAMKINQMLTNKCDFLEARVRALSSQQTQTRRVDMQNMRQELLNKLETMSVATAVSRMRQEQTLDLNDILQCILDVTDITNSSNLSSTFNNNTHNSNSPCVANNTTNNYTPRQRSNTSQSPRHYPSSTYQSPGAISSPSPGRSVLLSGGSISQDQFQSAIEYYK